MLRLLGIRKNRCSGSLVALLGNYLFDYPGDGDGGCDYDDGGGGDDDADGDDDDGGGDGDDHDDHDQVGLWRRAQEGLRPGGKGSQ